MTTLSVSVVMATYNGAAYIEQQLHSILGQLGNDDEVVVVDDHSVDATLDLVAKMNDARIHVYRNDANMGVQRTFEKAISLASNSIIFLSDQDDIWHPDKVRIVSDAFSRSPEVTLVLSDARIVDKDGRVVLNSFFEARGRFTPSVTANIVKNKHLGCVMAFRRILLDKILPFPQNIPQHDIWIGLVNGVYGKAHYVSTPLVDYRRHDRNASFASSNKRGTLLQMFRWRYMLLVSLLSRIYSLLRIGGTSKG